jgi:arylsulfatase A-like enzyme
MYSLKRSVLPVSSFLLLGSFFSCDFVDKSTSGSAGERPNIIFLLCDDLRWDALGFMGNNYVITPNIDKLADKSVLFNNVYHVSPICMPSRTAIMTGKYLGMHGSGFDRPTNYVITQEEFADSYPVLLNKAGYYTGFIGKFGFAVSRDSEKIVNRSHENRKEYMPLQRFDAWRGFPGQGRYRLQEDDSFNGYKNKWGATHLTEFMGHQSVEFLEEAKSQNQPFILSVSFKAPHAPFDPQERFRKLYDDLNIPRMSNDNPGSFSKLPKVVQQKSRNAKWYYGKIDRPAWQIENDSTYQEFIKDYFALITGIDDVVGQIRQSLDELGIADNTVIIFTSDNGFFCGSRQLMGKALLYSESVKAPLIVYDPRFRNGESGHEANSNDSLGTLNVRNGLISIIDIAPTILDIAGIEKPSGMPGKSFLPVFYGKTDEIHDALYGENNFDNFEPIISEVENPSEYQSIRSKFVRTKEFKYIRYHECQPIVEELFKISDDPFESVNLINQPGYDSTANFMRSMLNSFEDEFVNYSNVLNE